MDAPHQCAQHFRDWLRRRLTGCRFASELAAAVGEVTYQTVLPGFSTDSLSAFASSIDESAAANRTAVLLFPHMRTTAQLAVLLEILAADPRWNIRRVPWKTQLPEHTRSDCDLIAVDWTTANGDVSSAMGFAPLGTMPVTRRAPYYAIALWAGGHENPYKRSRGKRVGFIDAKHANDQAQHEKRWAQTEEDVGRLMSDPPEDGALFREVAFCVEAGAVAFLDAP